METLQATGTVRGVFFSLGNGASKSVLSQMQLKVKTRTCLQCTQAGVDIRIADRQKALMHNKLGIFDCGGNFLLAVSTEQIMQRRIMMKTPEKSDFCGISHFRGYNNPNTGTSAATPIVAEVIGLLKCARPDLTHTDVKAVLRKTAKDIGEPGFDPNSGYGIIQAQAPMN